MPTHPLASERDPVSLPLSAVAGTFKWPGFLLSHLQQPPYQRPTEDGTGLVDQGPVLYQVLSLFVDEGGRYILESEQNVFEVWDGFIAVYAGRFDPQGAESGSRAVGFGGGGEGMSGLERRSERWRVVVAALFVAAGQLAAACSGSGKEDTAPPPGNRSPG